MKIQLDSSALAALFPEGSDARIELQRCVIAEFTRRSLAKDMNASIANTVAAYLNEAKREYTTTIDRLIGEQFAGSWNICDVKDKSALHEAIRKRCYAEFTRFVKEVTDAEFKRLAQEDDLANRVAGRVRMAFANFEQSEVNRRIDEYVQHFKDAIK